MANKHEASTDYKEAFSLFDRRGNGRVALEQLGDLLRACGQNPTLQTISDLQSHMGGDFDYDSFVKVLNRPDGWRAPQGPEIYTLGFKTFDKENTGKIGSGQLKYVLTNFGEKFTEAEVDDLFKVIDVDENDEIDYNDMVLKILEQ
ncbi:hypothetical protein N7532_007343 [Penicillium argentinense]|uniref:Calmodulin n=1 Tax=Penicillium argentinense TaxID=1131581 RepID=A0A9W9F7I6_9EURO|nr:uncharacterized protein N7532_007343 [Penicillium argentinense]KAJ5095052.1 hypothetical protein N7532_007343 [Penicillium argentinense]